jgi:pimeloyl-ACP methyl ester carboxylesterase
MTDASPEKSASLLPLNRGSRGRPIYFAHPTSANAWIYRALIDQAQFERPAWGMRAPDLDWEQDVMSTSDMVQHYVTEIRRLQRVGPYSLAGFSFGGYLAFEIANRLATDGQEVEHLIMFDTPGPLPWSERVLSKRYARIKIGRLLCHAGRAGGRVLERAGVGWIQRAFLCLGTGPMTARELRRALEVTFPDSAPVARSASVRELCTAILDQFTHVQPPKPDPFWEHMGRRAQKEDPVVIVKSYKVWAKNFWLQAQHQPTAIYPGTITIFASRANARVLRWASYSSTPLDIRRLPIAQGAHMEFLDPANVALFVNDLKNLLEPASADRQSA